MVAALVLATAVVLPAPPAQAAPASVWLERSDPLSTDPIRLEVAAVDADGFALPFAGRVTVSVGRTRSTVPITGPTGDEEVEVPTTALAGGSATATAVLRVGGRTLRASIAGVADVPSTVELRGFGCDVVTPARPRIAWQVARLNGVPIDWPAWTPSADTFPAYVRTVRPSVITDSRDQPIRTRGSVVVTRGSKRVATIPLPPSARRRLLFSVPWPGTVAGRFAPGVYTATVTLLDASGRSSTASQQLLVARSAVGLCR